MDPNAVLHEWSCAVLSEDRKRANEAYYALRAWLDRGGFEPDFGKNGRATRAQFFAYDVNTGRIA